MPNQNPVSLDDLLEAARTHGLDSEPDHEVGDLQDLLRAVWLILTPPQQDALLRSNAARDVWHSAYGAIDPPTSQVNP